MSISLQVEDFQHTLKFTMGLLLGVEKMSTKTENGWVENTEVWRVRIVLPEYGNKVAEVKVPRSGLNVGIDFSGIANIGSGELTATIYNGKVSQITADRIDVKVKE